MVLAESNNLVLPSAASVVVAFAVVFVVAVLVAIGFAVWKDRRAARDGGAAPSTLAVVALGLVRVWMLAEVWRLGIRFQADAEGLV